MALTETKPLMRRFVSFGHLQVCGREGKKKKRTGEKEVIRREEAMKVNHR